MYYCGARHCDSYLHLTKSNILSLTGVHTELHFPMGLPLSQRNAIVNNSVFYSTLQTLPNSSSQKRFLLRLTLQTGKLQLWKVKGMIFNGNATKSLLLYRGACLPGYFFELNTCMCS